MRFGGVNRASLGVQSFDPAVQRAINRVQSFEATAAATEGLRRAGIAGINFDLIYGLPHQTVASCLDTVEKCVELRPDRFSVFGYAHVPSFKKHQRKIDEAALPDSLERHRQSEAIADALTKAGYVRIGLDHFALPGDRMAWRCARVRCAEISRATRPTPAMSCWGSAPAPSGVCRRAMCRTKSARGPIRNPSRGGRLATAKGYALTER